MKQFVDQEIYTLLSQNWDFFKGTQQDDWNCSFVFGQYHVHIYTRHGYPIINLYFRRTARVPYGQFMHKVGRPSYSNPPYKHLNYIHNRMRRALKLGYWPNDLKVFRAGDRRLLRSRWLQPDDLEIEAKNQELLQKR